MSAASRRARASSPPVLRLLLFSSSSLPHLFEHCPASLVSLSLFVSAFFVSFCCIASFVAGANSFTIPFSFTSPLHRRGLPALPRCVFAVCWCVTRGPRSRFSLSSPLCLSVLPYIFFFLKRYTPCFSSIWVLPPFFQRFILRLSCVCFHSSVVVVRTAALFKFLVYVAGLCPPPPLPLPSRLLLLVVPPRPSLYISPSTYRARLLSVPSRLLLRLCALVAELDVCSVACAGVCACATCTRVAVLALLPKHSARLVSLSLSGCLLRAAPPPTPDVEHSAGEC